MTKTSKSGAPTEPKVVKKRDNGEEEKGEEGKEGGNWSLFILVARV